MLLSNIYPRTAFLLNWPRRRLFWALLNLGMISFVLFSLLKMKLDQNLGNRENLVPERKTAFGIWFRVKALFSQTLLNVLPEFEAFWFLLRCWYVSPCLSFDLVGSIKIKLLVYNLHLAKLLLQHIYTILRYLYGPLTLCLYYCINASVTTCWRWRSKLYSFN